MFRQPGVLHKLLESPWTLKIEEVGDVTTVVWSYLEWKLCQPYAGGCA